MKLIALIRSKRPFAYLFEKLSLYTQEKVSINFLVGFTNFILTRKLVRFV